MYACESGSYNDFARDFAPAPGPLYVRTLSASLSERTGALAEDAISFRRVVTAATHTFGRPLRHRGYPRTPEGGHTRRASWNSLFKK